MPDYDGDGCCHCCIKFILTSGLTALFIWLSLRTSKPSCSIEAFYLPALNITDQSTTTRSNHSISFNIELKNTMKDKGVGYDDVNLTFSYFQNTSNASFDLIGTTTVHRFYQGHGKKAHKKGLVDTQGVPWDTALGAVSNGGKVIFRVDLVTKVRFKILAWYTKRHSLKVGANVEVNSSGIKDNRKNIKLKSGTLERRHYLGRVGFLHLVTIWILLLC